MQSIFMSYGHKFWQASLTSIDVLWNKMFWEDLQNSLVAGRQMESFTFFSHFDGKCMGVKPKQQFCEFWGYGHDMKIHKTSWTNRNTFDFKSH